jgi:hypothetical protein
MEVIRSSSVVVLAGLRAGKISYEIRTGAVVIVGSPRSR